MKIMSFNVLCWGREEHSFESRVPLVVKRIREQMPDILGTQESHIEWMDNICAGLPEYTYVGAGRDDGKDKGEFSPVFYRKDLYESEENGTFWLSETPEVPSKSWESACTRICTWTILRNKETGARFAAVNTHLDHVSEEARVKGIQLVVDKINTFTDLPVFCTGDFNTYEDSEAYRIMTSGVMADVKYLAADSDNGNTFTGFDPEATKNDSPIDFIFVKKDCVKVNSYKILRDDIDGQMPSDHYAIISEVEI
ncbi:MAG: endonuclease/exonuclease/phosphatase family protein [Clostridia bacterium]|nr:endonuclease/exonuclease/phosphatase family protein [Clostridia bacterium]